MAQLASIRPNSSPKEGSFIPWEQSLGGLPSSISCKAKTDPEKTHTINQAGHHGPVTQLLLRPYWV